jgi:CBS domain-containing protein
MKVKEIGLKNVYCANPSMSPKEIAAKMRTYNVGIIPVCDGEKLLGVLSDRDLVIRCMAGDTNPDVCMDREIMTSKPITVTPDTDLEQAAKIMGREQIRRLPVVQGGNLVGMISLGDIARALPDNDSLIAETLRKISTPVEASVTK